MACLAGALAALAGAGYVAVSEVSASPPTAPPAPSGLNIADRTDPLDVTGPPEFGWLPQSSYGDDVQTAYEIQVSLASSGALVWDSGEVTSSAESYVAYAGPTLSDGTSYTWTVRTWNSQGVASPYATPASFDTGINDSEWAGAQWIRRVTTGNDLTDDYTLYLKNFALSDAASPVTRARVYIAASAGLWQLHVNGQVVDTQYDYQAPGETYYDVENITSQAQAAQASGTYPDQMAIGVKYASWATTEGEPRMEGPVAASTTTSGASLVGATNLTVGSVTYYAPGENIAVGSVGATNFEVATVQSVNTATKSVAFTTPLQYAHPSASTVVAENGPSGLLAMVVVDYADGTSQTVVTNPSWLLTKDPEELNSTVSLRSSQDAGTYVEYDDGATALTDWDQPGFVPGASWVPATSMGTAPLVEPASCADYLSGGSPCGLTNVVPQQSSLNYEIVHPVSVTTLSDGTVEADFGTSIVGVPVVQVNNGVSGDVLDIDGSYRLDHAVLAATANVGATTITVTPPASSSGGFIVQPGDTITLDAPADGYGGGTPADAYEGSSVPNTDGGSLPGGETATVASVTTGTTDTIVLSAPLRYTHLSGAWVQGSRIGSPSAQDLDNQGTNLNFYYTEASGAQTSNFYVGEGYRYLQISNPDALADPGSSPINASQIWAVAQSENAPVSSNVYSIYGYDNGSTAPAQREATFTSSNSMLNDVFAMEQRAALYSGQEEFNDSPDRQDGQFLADGENESIPSMESLDERSLTREAIQNMIYSQDRYWLGDSMSAGGPTDVIVPPSSTASGNPGGDTFGDINAVYPDGDGMRDIPDYTEMFPEWVWDYYMQSGDLATLSSAYQAMEYVGDYVTNAIPTSGPFAGLVYNLPGGGTASGAYPNATETPSTSYGHGILDWPAPMRYKMTFLGSVAGGSSEAVIDDRAVQVYRSLAGAANALGYTSQAAAYTTQMNNLIAAINAKMIDTSGANAPTGSTGNGLYDEGVEATSSTAAATKLTGITEEHAQAFAVAYGVAPTSMDGTLGPVLAADGMQSGPMDVGQLETSLLDTGQDSALVSLLTTPTADGPAKILAEGGTSMWEQWDPGCSTNTCTGAQINQSNSGSDDIESFSHGWGATGIVEILRGLLGITVTGPGASTVQIQPPNGGLSSASGSEWTERGQVSVNWSTNSDDNYALTVTIPDNVTSTVKIPDPNSEGYYATGAGAPQLQGFSGGDAVFTVGSGTTTFVAPPVTTASLSPAPVDGFYNQDPTVTLSATDPNGPGVAHTYYQLDNQGYNLYTGPFTITGDGTHQLNYYSVDVNGDTESAGTLYPMVDTTPPVTTASVSPTPSSTPQAGTVNGAATVTLTATDSLPATGTMPPHSLPWPPNAPSGVAVTQYQLNGIGPDGTANTWYTYTGPFTISTGGATVVTYRSVDNAGNVESMHTLTLSVNPQVSQVYAGAVASQIGISLNGAPTIGNWTFLAGQEATYSASITASITSTASSTALTVADTSATAPGHLVNGPYALPQALQMDATDAANSTATWQSLGASTTTLLTYTAPVSSDAVMINAQQPIAATNPLHTGTYSKTFVFTVSVLTP